jgi:hypothetical protein
MDYMLNTDFPSTTWEFNCKIKSTLKRSFIVMKPNPRDSTLQNEQIDGKDLHTLITVLHDDWFLYFSKMLKVLF